MRVLVEKQGFKKTTIEEIAELANLNKSVFLARFGSKECALYIMYSEYCRATLTEMNKCSQQIESGDFSSLSNALYHVSSNFEQLQRKYYAENRAMLEIFASDLVINSETKVIFKRLVELISTACKYFSKNVHSPESIFSVSQMMVTLNYNHTLKAMPGIPEQHEIRQRMFVKVFETLLQR